MHYVSEDDLELLIFCVHLVGAQLLRCMLPKHSINRTSAQHLEVFFLLSCIWVFAASTLVVESVCVLHEYLVLRETREGIRSFGIGIQTVKSHHVSAESQTQVLGKSRQSF